LQIGDNERLYWWNHCLLAVGAGYSKRTQAHSSVSLGLERTRLTVPGAFGPKGVWQLLVDGGEESPLIREAHFFLAFIPERVNILVENTGHVTQGRISLAESGSLTLDPGTEIEFTREFQMLDICTEPDLEHLARLRRLLTDELPAGTTISRE
ncbi:MAG: hypothetical protein AABZ47_08320, partial [Planctomycetota bacterium]